MRKIRWFVLGVGLAVATGAWAQEAPRPAVKVVVGADGTVKVFDASTGKEIPAKVARPQGKNAEDERRQEGDQDLLKAARQRREVEQQRRDEDQKRRDLEKARRDAEKALDEARREIEKILKERQKDAKPEPKRGDGKPKVIELELRDIIIDKDKRPGQPASVDQKLDLILKQMAELRRDVDQIKSRLDGKGPPMWDFKPRPGDAKDKKPGGPVFEFKLKPGGPGQMDEETLKRILDMIKVHDSINKLEDKKARDNAQRTPPPPNRNAEIEQRLERIMREAEELRREILKSKSSR